MFRDFKSGGYSLEGSQLAPQYLSKLIIVIAIAYTSPTMQGKKIKDMGIQKYVTRPEKRYKGQRRHSSFYVGQHLYHWLQLHQMFPNNIEELMGLRQKTNREKPQLQSPLGIYFEKPKIAETQIYQGKS
jgi:hypothetical protein